MNVTVYKGNAGPTYLVTGTDAAAGLAAAKLLNETPREMVAALIECDQGTGYGIRYAFGGTLPTQGSPSTMHYLAPGSVVVIEGHATLKSLRFINETNAENAKLWVTPYY
uniref:Uncharacterized protein n=1 Tax=viral metagenome TaxID=1070528 RepID=A0A6M3IKV1_9ZZZZ